LKDHSFRAINEAIDDYNNLVQKEAAKQKYDELKTRVDEFLQAMLPTEEEELIKFGRERQAELQKLDRNATSVNDYTKILNEKMASIKPQVATLSQ